MSTTTTQDKVIKNGLAAVHKAEHNRLDRTFGEDGYDENGFDRDGYDRDGFDGEGWSREGINRETGTRYDRDGYDIDGYDERVWARRAAGIAHALTTYGVMSAGDLADMFHGIKIGPISKEFSVEWPGLYLDTVPVDYED